MEGLWLDIRYGIRSLARSPLFTVIAVLTLALGIGANAAIFSLTDQVLLRRLPVQKPDELVNLSSPGPNPGHTWSDGIDGGTFSYPQYKDLRSLTEVFAGVLARYPLSLSVAGQGQTERADGELVSGNYFYVLGVRPALGRVFTTQDETAPGANSVAVLSYGYWVRHFGSDPSILNKQISVNGTAITVVGVARSGFSGVQIGQAPDLFIPVTMKASMTPNWNGLEDRKDHWLALIGRMNPGFTLARAQVAIEPAFHAILESELPALKLTAQNQQRFLSRKLLLTPGSNGRQILQLDASQPLRLLMAMVGLVLLIACANLASLLVARAEPRQREIAVRLAIGSGRWRLVKQLLTESLVLSLAGGAAGLVLASWTLESLVASLSQGIEAMGLEARLDYRVLLFAIALSLVTGVLFGLAPALRATRADLQTILKNQGSSVSGGRSSVRMRKSLIVSQVALTAVLLTGAGLFTRSLTNLRNMNIGLRTDHVVEFSIAPELNRYTPARTTALFDQIREKIAALPGVRSVSLATIPVLANSERGGNFTIEGYTAPDNEEVMADYNWVGPDFLSTLGIPLLMGREFTASDHAGAAKVAVINETMVKKYFNSRNPIGVRMARGAGSGAQPDIEIVGVVKDSAHNDLRSKIQPFVFRPYAQDDKLGEATFYVRTSRDPSAMGSTLRSVVNALDPSLPVYDLKTLEDQLSDSLYADQLLTTLSLALGLLASLLAAVGLYGVMAYQVVRRTREIGIRMALGAEREGIAWLVIREVLRMTAISLGIGLPLAYAFGRLVESLLFGVKAGDPLVFAISSVFLSAVTLIASGLPALRAAGVKPMAALRYE